MILISSNLQTKYLNKVKIQLLTRKKWGYLRYIHLREGLKIALESKENISSFLSIGCGTGLVEVAISLEFPEIQFNLTDIGNLDTMKNRLGIRMVEEWGIPNVKYSLYDVLTPSKNCYDFVASVEVLEHLKDDTLASNNMCEAALKYVFALVPFATEEQNLDKQLKNTVWKNHEHYKVGYNYNSLANLFAKNIVICGCYWEDSGLRFREKLDDLSHEEIQSCALDLMKLAQSDLYNDLHLPNNYRKCRGIWILSKV
ncbi:MAG: hypothetical protein RLZZ04_2304 [Cyanobacteriota bacterium]|jgi:hypothetical protein